MGVAMLGLTNVSKTYHDHRRSITAVDGVDVVIRPGEAFGLIGPSGSGKSTLLQILAGLTAPTSGQVLRPERVGLAFQDPLLYPWLTVRENIGLARRFTAHREIDRSRVDTLIDEFGLAALADANPTSLSGGQAQRVALARALVTRPKALLLDEPFGALDPAARTALQDWLRDWLRNHDIPLALVTHDVSEALLICDRVALLLPGVVGLAGAWDVPELTREQINNNPLLIEILGTYRTDVTGAPSGNAMERTVA
jgi:ABC-type nitrate/sulfonate/bicarbonate transport system ATPase subunit